MALSAADEQAPLKASWVAELFHDFPHIDYKFSAVNSTFDPRSNLYLESLGIIASVPGFWLILNLLAFLIFFLSRCCERDWKPKNLTCYKWTLGVFAALCCGALGVGFYGNEDAHSGVVRFASSVRNINDIITSVKNETQLIEQTLEMNTGPELDRLEELFRRPIGNGTAQELLRQAVKAMRADVHNGTNNIARINNRIRQLDLGNIPKLTSQVETIRWPVTMAVLSVFMLFCVILVAGVIRNSRSTLIAFTVLGLLAVILNWLLVSVYVAACVGLGDLCVDPDYFIEKQAGSLLDRSIVEYYMKCPEGRRSPFYKALENGKLNVQNVEKKLDFIAEAAKLYYSDTHILQNILTSLRAHLNLTDRVLANLSTFLGCSAIHSEYNASVTAICTPVLNGLALMLLSTASAGLFFIFLIWIAAHTWMYIRKRVVCPESDYVQVDQQDPFLPPSAVMVPSSAVGPRRPRDVPVTGRPRHTPPHTPPFPGAYNGRIPRGADDHLPVHGRYTPPPSYEQLSPAFLPSAPYKS